MLDKAKIKAAIQMVRRKGWDIQPRVTCIVAAKTCCPIAALDVANGVLPRLLSDTAIRHDISGEAEAFANGFDGLSHWSLGKIRAAYRLGVEMRKEYLAGTL